MELIIQRQNMNIYQTGNHFNRGFTLIETIIYISIFIFILTISMSFLLIETFDNTQLNETTVQQMTGRDLSYTIGEIVMSAENISEPTYANPTSSSLQLTDANSNNIDIYLQNNTVYEKINSNSPIDITGNISKVNTLNFIIESQSGQTPSIEVYIDISAPNGLFPQNFDNVFSNRKV